MDSKQLPSLSRVFAHRSRLTACSVGLAITLVFGVAGTQLVIRVVRQGNLREARVCAAVLQPDRHGDLDSAIDRLRSQYPTLAAVATLDVRGSIRTVYPDRQSFARALQSSLSDPGVPVHTSALNEGSARRAWATTLPLGGIKDPSARRIALLLWDDASLWSRFVPLGVATLMGIVIAFIGCETWIGWFERRIAEPIRRLRFSLERTSAAGRRPRMESPNWRELEGITAQFRQVVHDTRRVEREARQQVRDDRKGFDRRLRRAEDRALTDPLTGLHNRVFLDTELDALYRRQHDQGNDLSVVMIDLDNFKHLNDTHGHAAGDDLLRVTGELLRAAIRPTDYAVRYGGDEFVLLLPGAGIDEAVRVVERIVKLFRQRVRSFRAAKPISMSAGVAALKSERVGDGSDLLQTADEALYRAKRSGKNAVLTGRVVVPV